MNCIFHNHHAEKATWMFKRFLHELSCFFEVHYFFNWEIFGLLLPELNYVTGHDHCIQHFTTAFNFAAITNHSDLWMWNCTVTWTCTAWQCHLYLDLHIYLTAKFYVTFVILLPTSLTTCFDVQWVFCECAFKLKSFKLLPRTWCLLDRASCDGWRIKNHLDVTCYFYFPS